MDHSYPKSSYFILYKFYFDDSQWKVALEVCMVRNVINLVLRDAQSYYPILSCKP